MNHEWSDVPKGRTAEKEAPSPSGQHHATERRGVLLALRAAGRKLETLRVPGGTSCILLSAPAPTVRRIWFESLPLPSTSPRRPHGSPSESEGTKIVGNPGAAGV